MNPPPTVGLKTLIIFGLSFTKQLAHGLVKRFAGYVTLLNAFVLVGAIVEWVGRILALTYLIIPNSPPPNSSFEVGGLQVSSPTLPSAISLAQ